MLLISGLPCVQPNTVGVTVLAWSFSLADSQIDVSALIFVLPEKFNHGVRVNSKFNNSVSVLESYLFGGCFGCVGFLFVWHNYLVLIPLDSANAIQQQCWTASMAWVFLGFMFRSIAACRILPLHNLSNSARAASICSL